MLNIFKALMITSWDEETAAENNGNYDQNHSEKKKPFHFCDTLSYPPTFCFLLSVSFKIFSNKA